MRTVVLDTNVLLSDPEVLFAFPEANVIVPETVLGEIDKLKVSRVDQDLRFRGREVSRMLFELSEQGSLVDGVSLPDGGTLQVRPLDTEAELPEGLGTRNADDRILATAYQACSAGCEDITLVTNDLNMLLKAQTYGIEVERRGESEAGIGKRTLRWFQRYKTPMTILAIAVAVFAGVLLLTTRLADIGNGNGGTTVPDEFRDSLTGDYRNLLDGLVTLESDPDDLESLRAVGDSYYNLYQQFGNVGFAQDAITYYERYLRQVPDDNNVRTDMAVLLFALGSADRAIQEVTTVLASDPDHIDANFNLGVFYLGSNRRDYVNGAKQLMKVIDLAAGVSDAHVAEVERDARTLLGHVKTEAESVGVDLDIPAEYLPTGGP